MELTEFLSRTYGFQVQDIWAAKRGFYGETWKVRAKEADYFVKIDYWTHHMESYQASLPVIQYMTQQGISFIPQVVKTKDGELSGRFNQGVAAVFAYVQGELYENPGVEQLYGKMAQVYQLRPEGIAMDRETFGTEIADDFQRLQNAQGLPEQVAAALKEKQRVISGYMERLKFFSAQCSQDMGNFHITHGDVGGNCILNGERLSIVDWDGVKYAPVERDAWILLCEWRHLEKVNAILKENNIEYRLRQERLGYYCYSFFFHYLGEYLRSMLNAREEKQKQDLAEKCMDYLQNSWIFRQLARADLF